MPGGMGGWSLRLVSGILEPGSPIASRSCPPQTSGRCDVARRSPRTAGSIRKLASGRYQARWWDDALRRRVPAPPTFETKSDASRWLAQKESGLFQEPEVEKELAPTLRSYADDWMATRTLRPGTQALYRSQLRRHLCLTFGETRLDGITPAEVRRWYAGRIETGLATVTVAKQYRLLRAILSPAVDRHVDIAGARISVTRSLQEITGQGAVLSPTKSTSGVRVVAIPQRLVDVLEAHLAEHVGADPDSLLFTNGCGRPVRASLWTPAWDSAREKAGVDVRLHDLRHLAGTLTAQAGATLREIMDRLGHSSPQAAMRYQHVALERNERIARAIDDLLDADDEDQGDETEDHGS